VAYYSDLSPCDYFDLPLTGPLVAVGWLAAGQPFSVGDPGPDVYARLKQFLKGRWQPVLFAGSHECELCRYDGFCSHANLFIPGTRVTYAAPEAIVHYIACHGYLPPEEFCRALVSAPAPDSPEYFEGLKANGWPADIARADDPLTEDELRLTLLEKILKARGDALCAALDAFKEINGYYPSTLGDAVALVDDTLKWSYSTERDGYRIGTDWTSVAGFELFRYSTMSEWCAACVWPAGDKQKEPRS
jgi:hypothetical protein